MKRYQGYKIAIFVLSIIIIIQWISIIIISRPKKIPKAPIVIKGKIAIVIDDWGYNLNNLEALGQIKYPLTVSILPNLDYSKKIAQEAHKQNLEVILHLPMQPHERLRLEKNTILTSMDESTITNILRKDLDNVLHAKGVSNHMGSKATEDTRVMGIIFKELKAKKLYFLDSLVSGESICFDLAQKTNLDFAKRDVFLDNKEDKEYIRAQLLRLKTRASVYKEAIGIGHDRKITLEVLREVMPGMEKEGYKFVFVSELIK